MSTIEVTAHSIGKQHGTLSKLASKAALAPGFAEKVEIICGMWRGHLDSENRRSQLLAPAPSLALLIHVKHLFYPNLEINLEKHRKSIFLGLHVCPSF